MSAEMLALIAPLLSGVLAAVGAYAGVRVEIRNIWRAIEKNDNAIEQMRLRVDTFIYPER